MWRCGSLKKKVRVANEGIGNEREKVKIIINATIRFNASRNMCVCGEEIDLLKETPKWPKNIEYFRE